MGIISKLFGKKKEVKQPVKKVLKPQLQPQKPKVVQVNKMEESRTTLRYDEQVITIEAFREGIRQRATIKAFRDGKFIPLQDLGRDLVIFDVNEDGFIPLIDSVNPQHQDVKEFVFGKQTSSYTEVQEEDVDGYEEDEEEVEEDEDEEEQR